MQRCSQLVASAGVVEGNISALMHAAGSLQGLGKMTQDEIQATIGQQPGKSLFTFLHQRYPLAS